MSDLKAIYILLLLCLISANEIVYKCKPEDSEKEVEIGDEVTLCIHTIELQKKVAFKIKVDEYSIISIKDAFTKIVLPKEDGTKNSGRRLESSRNLKYESIYEDDPDNPSTPDTSSEAPSTPDTSSEAPSTPDTSSQEPSTPDTYTPSEEPSTPSDQTEVEEQEEFITQIGNVKNKYPNVMLYIFYFFFFNIVIFHKGVIFN